MLSTTFLLSKTFLLSQSHPSAAHAFNYNIPFIKNILFIKIFPPSAAHAFNYIPFIKNIPFITIFPPPLQPMLSTTTFLLSKTLLLSQFPPSAEASKLLHLPHKKPFDPSQQACIGSGGSSQRHHNCCTCHTKAI